MSHFIVAKNAIAAISDNSLESLGLTREMAIHALVNAAQGPSEAADAPEPLNVSEDITGDSNGLPDDVYTLSGLVTSIARPVNATWEMAELQLKLIKSEVAEMEEAVATKDVDAFVDANNDIIFLTSANAYLLNFDFLPSYKVMCSALLSRFDDTKADADLTRDKYLDLGILTYNRCVNSSIGKRWVTYVDEDVTINGELFPQHKWLKSHKYHNPVYTSHPTLT